MSLEVLGAPLSIATTGYDNRLKNKVERFSLENGTLVADCLENTGHTVPESSCTIRLRAIYGTVFARGIRGTNE
jgi:hypothetical protein